MPRFAGTPHRPRGASRNCGWRRCCPAFPLPREIRPSCAPAPHRPARGPHKRAALVSILRAPRGPFPGRAEDRRRTLEGCTARIARRSAARSVVNGRSAAHPPPREAAARGRLPGSESSNAQGFRAFPVDPWRLARGARLRPDRSVQHHHHAAALERGAPSRICQRQNEQQQENNLRQKRPGLAKFPPARLRDRLHAGPETQRGNFAVLRAAMMQIEP